MPSPRKPASPFRYFNSSPEVIRLVVMMYVRFPLSLRNVEDLLFERGIDISHETVRHWWNRFGPDVRRQHPPRVSRMRGYRQWNWHLDEMYVKINGEIHYLWRAIDQEGEILESYVTRTRDKVAALTFMKKALKRHGSPEAITTDGLRSYRAVMNDLGNSHKQEIGRWANNHIEGSHTPVRRRQRAMLRFRQMKTFKSSLRSTPPSTITSASNAISSTDRLTRPAAQLLWLCGRASLPDDQAGRAPQRPPERVAVRLTPALRPLIVSVGRFANGQLTGSGLSKAVVQSTQSFL